MKEPERYTFYMYKTFYRTVASIHFSQPKEGESENLTLKT